MPNEHSQRNLNCRAARAERDKLRLAHEAAIIELSACRARLKMAEANRGSDPRRYFAALEETRAQRDRVVNLVEQIRIAEAHLTLAVAAAQAVYDDRSATHENGVTRTADARLRRAQ